jgi:hypothetical protein
MAPLETWVDIDPQSHFSIYNIPFGIITMVDNAEKPLPLATMHSICRPSLKAMASLHCPPSNLIRKFSMSQL